MRKPRRIHDAGAAGPHDHVAWFGDGLDDLYELAVDALADGARRGEKLLFVADKPHLSRLGQVDNLERLLAEGQLEVLDSDVVYGPDPSVRATSYLVTFQALLQQALTQGYGGLRVIADNTRLASGSEDDYDKWLAWEQVMDGFEAEARVTGFCYFDRRVVLEDRQVTLAALHPVRSTTIREPPFTFTATASGRLVNGTLDVFSARYFRRAIAAAPTDGPLVVDVAGAEFVDHRALLTLMEAATATRPVVIRDAQPVLKKLVGLLGVETPYLSFEQSVEGLTEPHRDELLDLGPGKWFIDVEAQRP